MATVLVVGRRALSRDPLSPFLFLLAAEGLNVMINSLVDNGLFSGYIVGAQEFV